LKKKKLKKEKEKEEESRQAHGLRAEKGVSEQFMAGRKEVE